MATLSMGCRELDMAGIKERVGCRGRGPVAGHKLGILPAGDAPKLWRQTRRQLPLCANLL
jgi:hypothetical protein